MSGGWGGGGGGGGGANIPLDSSISGSGETTGTTPVIMVPAPPSAKKYYVLDINIYNADTQPATIIVKLTDSANVDVILKKMIMDPQDITALGGMLLDTVNKTITIELAGAVTTTEVEWAVTYGEAGV